MAKVTGPLFSLDARNKVGDVLVYSYWKGRNTVRVLIVPENPRTNAQARTRTFLGATGSNNRMIESKAAPGVLLTQLMAKTPADQSWMSYFVKSQIGTGNSRILAARLAWTSISDTKKAFWADAAATIPLTGFNVGYGEELPISAGEQLFISATGARAMGLAITPVDPSDMTDDNINAFAAAYSAAD